MRHVAVVLLLGLCGCRGAKLPAPPDPQVRTAPKKLLQLTYAYERQGEKGIEIVTGHATAFGIDFRNSSRYVLTAGHNVLSGGMLLGEVTVAVEGFKTKAFLVKVDPLTDIALLRTVENVPFVHPLVDPKEVSLLIGRRNGDLDFVNMHPERIEMSVDIEEGDSGAPVLEPETGHVVGMLVARIGPSQSKMRHGIFVTAYRIREFLKTIPEQESKP